MNQQINEQLEAKIKEQEIQDWIDSLHYAINSSDEEHVVNIIKTLHTEAFEHGFKLPFTRTTPYINSIPLNKQPNFPGNQNIERRIRSYIRWNAMVMVSQSNNKSAGLGGHISTFASAATLYEIGFNHFFKAPSTDYAGDLIYIQGHASPGIYARAFLEGRLSKKKIENFRRELANGGGLPSYPHPRLLPDFWQFPTVSMGLGPIMAIYQARFAKYLEHRSLKPDNGGKIWAFVGDGETDEPETLGAIHLAVREKLNNLIFIINCNLQRLDGPVRGNGKIIQELEGIFRGAGWHVIKVIWGSNWDSLLEKDTTGLLKKRMEEAVDGDYQKYATAGGDYIRKHFFGKYPELLEMVKDLTDDELANLNRGGHDNNKVYASYKEASQNESSPTVILAQTIKGYGMGESGQAKNITHQQKSISREDLINFRHKFNLPFSDKAMENFEFFKPPDNSEEIKYLKQRRKTLGGYLPARSEKYANNLKLEFDENIYDEFYEGSKDRELSSTMSFVRLMTKLIRDKKNGKYVVPIVPDEARTFGMEGLFSQIGIYSSVGQTYEPVDKDSLLYYNEKTDGQMLEEGITEAGAMSSFIAAGTAYSNYGIPTLPFYIYYSMFGFQRIADLAWAAGDIMTKGFMIGATAGRTTLAGEGLQHQDGHSLVTASTIPCIKCYDATFAYEIATIVKAGIKEMYHDGQHVFYYITVYNENYAMPKMPAHVKPEDILKGIYLFQASEIKKTKMPKINLWGSGPILLESIKAAKILEDYQLSVDVWSVTSYNEVRREALGIENKNFIDVENESVPYISKLFNKDDSFIIAASDYMKILPDSLQKWVSIPIYALGTDGFGRSETRSELRKYFKVDSKHIAWAAIVQLYKNKKLDKVKVKKIKAELDITGDYPDPLSV